MKKRDLQVTQNRSERRNPEDALLKKQDLASRLGCSVRQVELMVKAGTLISPFYISDASPRWRRSDIDAWLERLANDAQGNGEVSK